MTTTKTTEFTVPTDEPTVLITRILDAPPARVFEALTDPEQIKQWWGPSSLKTKIEEHSAERGGRWRYVHVDDAGNEYGFNGVHHEVSAPERIVRTFEFEGVPGHVMLETIELEDLDGQTRAVATAAYASFADRDGMVDSGMESGATESWERLAELVEGSG